MINFFPISILRRIITNDVGENEATHSEYYQDKLRGINPHPIKDLNSKLLSSNKASVIFLIGPWGHGKSTLLKSLIQFSTIKTLYSIRWASFLPINNLNDAFFHLLHRTTILAIVIIIVVLLYFNIISFDLTNIAFVSLLFFFHSSVQKIIYVVFSTLQLIFLGKKEALIIIDDVDRSGLSENDIISLFQNLYPIRTTYIINYGYHSNEQKVKILELIKKLNADYLDLGLDPELMIRYIKSITPHFPFEYEDWMKRLSLRDFNSYILKIENEINGQDTTDIQIIHMKAMFNLMCKTYEIENIIHQLRFSNRTDMIIDPSLHQTYPSEVSTFGRTTVVLLLDIFSTKVFYSNMINVNQNDWRALNYRFFFEDDYVGNIRGSTFRKIQF